MDIMENKFALVAIIFSLLIIMGLSGCAGDSYNPAVAEAPDINEDISDIEEPPSIEQSQSMEELLGEEDLPWRIAIITNPRDGADDGAYLSARDLVAKFGEDRVMHRTSYLTFGWFDWSPIVNEIAEDLEIGAVIISSFDFFLDRERPQSSPIDELLRMRDDIFVVYTGPVSYPLCPASVTERADLVINTNYYGVVWR